MLVTWRSVVGNARGPKAPAMSFCLVNGMRYCVLDIIQPWPGRDGDVQLHFDAVRVFYFRVSPYSSFYH